MRAMHDDGQLGREFGRRSMGARLALVAAIVALVGGFALGRTFDAAPKASTAPLVTPAQIAAAAANAGAGGHSHGTVADRGFAQLENGVQHTHTFEQPVDPLSRALLTHQLTLARQVAEQYPTLADAERAGLRRAGPFSPGLGTHLISFGSVAYSAGKSVMNDDQIRHPLAWIYDGTKPDSPIAGLFYMASVLKPGGFAGTNDAWHYHQNICITRAPAGGVDAPLGADHDATKAQCDAVHGALIKNTGPLLHVWVLPGYDDSQGVFAHLNPAITCNDGTYHIVDITKVGTRTSACRDGTE
jgi:hypothetical protein